MDIAVIAGVASTVIASIGAYLTARYQTRHEREKTIRDAEQQLESRLAEAQAKAIEEMRSSFAVMLNGYQDQLTTTEGVLENMRGRYDQQYSLNGQLTAHVARFEAWADSVENWARSAHDELAKVGIQIPDLPPRPKKP